jgi:CRISPR/Cas system CMR subunit Cmr4 (Cas7 group RAMP superfamily)
MEEQKQYHDELLEWCNIMYYHCNRMKPMVSNLLEMEQLEEWEGSCRQLKDKLQADLNVDFDDYLTAKSLYEQWEQLRIETNAYQEVDSDHRLELEEQTPIQEELFETDTDYEENEVDLNQRLELEEQIPIQEELVETDANQEVLEIDSNIRLELEEQTQIQGELVETDAFPEETEKYTGVEVEEQLQYREALLERFNNMDDHWESMRPSFSKLFESLVDWEVSYRHLKDKLQADLKAHLDDYQTVTDLMNSENSYSNNRMHIKKR